jgi:hypothetical protein
VTRHPVRRLRFDIPNDIAVTHDFATLEACGMLA